MKRFFKILFGVVFALLLFVTPVAALVFDKTYPGDEALQLTTTPYFSYVRIETTGIAQGVYPHEGTWRLREIEYAMRGSGFVLPGGFIITAAHVIVPEEVATPCSRYGVYVTKPFKVLTTTIKIFDYKDEPLIAWAFHIDIEFDTAVLRYDTTGDLLEPIPVELMTFAKDMLEEGDIIATVVHVRDPDENELESSVQILYGKVIKNGVRTGQEEGIPWFNTQDITMDLPIMPGDSGSPLFVFMHGKPYLIGVVRACSVDLENSNPFGFGWKMLYSHAVIFYGWLDKILNVR